MKLLIILALAFVLIGQAGAITKTPWATINTTQTFPNALAMGNYKITGLGTPSAATDAATKGYADTYTALQVNKSGGTWSGNMDAGGYKVTGSANGSSATDLMTIRQGWDKLNESGGTMTGVLNVVNGTGQAAASYAQLQTMPFGITVGPAADGKPYTYKTDGTADQVQVNAALTESRGRFPVYLIGSTVISTPIVMSYHGLSLIGVGYDYEWGHLNGTSIEVGSNIDAIQIIGSSINVKNLHIVNTTALSAGWAINASGSLYLCLEDIDIHGTANGIKLMRGNSPGTYCQIGYLTRLNIVRVPGTNIELDTVNEIQLNGIIASGGHAGKGLYIHGYGSLPSENVYGTDISFLDCGANLYIEGLDNGRFTNTYFDQGIYNNRIFSPAAPSNIWTSGIWFVNSWFTTNPATDAYGLYCYGVNTSGIHIVDSVIRGTGNVGIGIGNDEFYIDGCEFYSCGMNQGVGNGAAITTLLPSRNIRITDNIFIASEYMDLGIYAQDMDNLTFTGNSKVTDNYPLLMIYAGLADPTNVIHPNTGMDRQGATASVADGGTVAHYLQGTPSGVSATGTVAGNVVTVTTLSSSTFTAAIKTGAGNPGTTQTLYWHAWSDTG